ncbi:MAG TPA: flagellar biosynthesis protein FlhF, partial [Plasticicumulans sp.]|nr:flagellar biosynthesis protein FlhF [Plasticicumulans sp.]
VAPLRAPVEPLLREARPAASRSAGVAAAAAPARQESGARHNVTWAQDPVITQMQTEISALRQLLEQQLTSIAWGREGSRQPRRFELLERLLKFGLDAELCYELCDAALSEPDNERAWQSALGQLHRGIVTMDDDPLDRGGAIALVGPTGVGKTTTVAKLAARYALRHGPRKVGLITTDGYRIGAYDQLRTYGILLDLPVRVAGDAPELRQALSDFSDKSLVLIDTAGMGLRDVRLAQQIGMLQTAPAIHNYLVLPANGHPAALGESVQAFAGVQLTGGILSKLDEAARIAGVLSLLYRTGLPLAWFTNGQRVPEDIVSARAETLMATALDQQLDDCGIADDAMLVTWGRRIVNACQ